MTTLPESDVARRVAYWQSEQKTARARLAQCNLMIESALNNWKPKAEADALRCTLGVHDWICEYSGGYDVSECRICGRKEYA